MLMKSMKKIPTIEQEKNHQQILHARKRLSRVSSEFDDVGNDGDDDLDNSELENHEFITFETLLGNVAKNETKSARDDINGRYRK